MSGPCLCGDPYCPSCGNPGLAAMADVEEAFMEKLGKIFSTPEEYIMLGNIAEVLAKDFNKAIKEMVNDQMSGTGEYIGHLETKIASLEDQIKPRDLIEHRWKPMSDAKIEGPSGWRDYSTAWLKCEKCGAEHEQDAYSIAPQFGCTKLI